jgi:hypothetical protein
VLVMLGVIAAVAVNIDQQGKARQHIGNQV